MKTNKFLYALFVIAIITGMGEVLMAQKNKDNKVNFPIDEKTKMVTYQEIIDADTSADRLMERAIVWAEHYYKSPGTVIQEKNHEENYIVCRHQFEVWNLDKKGNNESKGPRIDYQLKIETKDKRYQYTIYKINKKNATYFGIEEWIDYPEKYDFAQEYLPQIDKFMQDLITDMKKWMLPYDEEKIKNW